MPFYFKASLKKSFYESKTIKTSLGESEIRVPRDRDGSFNPMIVPKRKNIIDGIKNVVISLYANEDELVSDIED